MSQRPLTVTCILEFPSRYRNNLRLLNLLLENVLEGNGVSRELGDTLAELLDGHLLLVEVEAEGGLVVDVGLLLDVEAGSVGSIELLGDGLLGVVEILKKVGLRSVSIRFFRQFSVSGEHTEMVR